VNKLNCIKAALVTFVVSLPINLLAGYGYPGWGYGSPGYGPGPEPESIELSCLSALASKNPVLILQACDFLDADGVANRQQVTVEEGSGDQIRVQNWP
jgi:hypothetical protein